MLIYRPILPVILVFLFFHCRRQDPCPTVPSREIVRDIASTSPDSRLDIFVTESILLVNGAPVGQIRNGQFTDASVRSIYPPLLESVYQEFTRRGSNPYTEILIYMHEEHPKELVDLVHRTVLQTQLAPVILMPMNFTRTRCNYEAEKAAEVTPAKLEGTLLVRQEKDRILVDGETVLELEKGQIPQDSLDRDRIICIPLLERLEKILPSLPRDAVPVLHLTLEADPEVTKYILVTAGKAGIMRFKTVRVIE